MNQNKKVIELKKITKSFDGEQILKGIDLDIHEILVTGADYPCGCEIVYPLCAKVELVFIKRE